MRIEESFTVGREPAQVFDYLIDPATLPDWQTSKVSVQQLTPGPPARGTRYREVTRPPAGKEFEQLTELTEFDRPRRVTVHVVEGPHPIDGTWTFAPAEGGTAVSFVAEGEVSGVLGRLGPVGRRLLSRQFAAYHRKLRENLEAG
jgi:carbon monoxide dehydrogenase subunit G